MSRRWATRLAWLCGSRLRRARSRIRLHARQRVVHEDRLRRHAGLNDAHALMRRAHLAGFVRHRQCDQVHPRRVVNVSGTETRKLIKSRCRRGIAKIPLVSRRQWRADTEVRADRQARLHRVDVNRLTGRQDSIVV